MAWRLACALAWQLGPPAVEWDAPPSCPPASEVEAKLAELSVASEPPDGASLRGRVRRVDEHWELTLDLVGPRGPEHRTLVADDCRDLADAAALIAAAAFDPTASDPAAPDPSTLAPVASDAMPTPRPEPGHTAQPTTVTERDEAPSSAPTPVDREPARAHRRGTSTASSAARVVARILARAGGGRVAGSDVGLVAGVGAQWARLRVDAWASAFVPGIALHPTRDADAVTTLGTVGVRAGARWAWRRVSLLVYGAVEAGPARMRGRGAGIDRALRGWTAWVGIGPQIAATWRATPWLAWVVEAELFGAAVRPQATVRGEPSFWTAAPVAGGVALGLELGPFDARGRQSARNRRRSAMDAHARPAVVAR